MKRMFLELDKLTHKQLEKLLQSCTDEVRSRNGGPVLPTPNRTPLQMQKCVVLERYVGWSTTMERKPQ
jgi:hypothetical protein